MLNTNQSMYISSTLHNSEPQFVKDFKATLVQHIQIYIEIPFYFPKTDINGT